MTEIAHSERQITVYYNPESSIGMKALAYLQESKFPVLLIDIIKNPPTSAQWIEIAEGLGVDVSELVQKDHPAFTCQYPPSELNAEDWLKIMHKHPEVIDQPIILRGRRALLIRTPTDVLKILDSKN